jgi:hypothetical protein
MEPEFITAFTSAHHLSLSWATSIQIMPSIPIPEDLSYYYPPIYTWGLPGGFFPSGFPTNTLCALLLSPYMLYAPPISFFSIWSVFVNRYEKKNPLPRVFLEHKKYNVTVFRTENDVFCSASSAVTLVAYTAGHLFSTFVILISVISSSSCIVLCPL